ncbi:ABC transporter [bacterium (Candidatus Blackallbacteria) CG17_big_fil_post_rev_8_21_14_2_50_48_46]|uniref:ABC transporter n=1 Tax=bacterium (Candidatus Blackallbacteria) CG17_big_fil_post_rev_8_21_14_2_50_48_46 TaxID=2014261 RepID=A0A2M7G0V0_9BACT|nr:MAG: ABC transporter [bacterium (Candidatus Blackallbacteria) CG18_big_fil_WC_8_21_14_2_50_49_26]PIW15309.1 MAG: ABC transporter [bacterium (Candidatus Blackallbacteria) CG17_big_fil_post_rev_8_21_14_2_50_48_46]PIW45181.1 MAG: ABC transporter [bacterium (Candidatus Blackallbacteria) CG13_big_fil_rev_8_21_14_2_50_49_14]
MKSIDKIPTGKIQRASKLVGTGVKVGGNYLKHYGEKLLNPDLDRSSLDQANAEEIFKSLKSLKGSALKAAQLLSMEKNLLPQAYIDTFSLAQFQVPPLSAPLVRKTFRQYLGCPPEEIFAHFEAESVAAASIGQVHKARSKEGRDLAVKLQYPGVAESISSDLAIVKPIALRMFNLNAEDVEHYFQEVRSKLLEETDYTLELRQSQQMAKDCAHLPGLRFPAYYPEYSSPRILTMDWIEGEPLSRFAERSPALAERTQVAQTLWDWYLYQVHQLRYMHADPHPGNFLVAQGDLVAIDFGCIKQIPEAFYLPYFELSSPESLADPARMQACLERLELLRPTDSQDDRNYLTAAFRELAELIARPFHQERFDFSNAEFFATINALGERFARDSRLRKLTGGRGSQHFLYANRTFFGLFMLQHALGVEIETQQYRRWLKA